MPVSAELKTFIEDCKTDYNSKLVLYQQIDRYYKGNSDVVIEKSEIDTASTDKIENNYFKKYIKEEVDYILGNDVTMVNLDPNENLEEIVNYNFSPWPKNHNKRLFRKTLTFGRSFELYYVNKKSEFSSRIISPLNGYAYFDEHEELIAFLHFFRKPLDRNNSLFMDVYINNMIYHFKDDVFIGENTHIFGMEPPVGCCMVDDFQQDILFKDIKSLQDAYELNLTDLSHEISQHRQSYLKMLNIEIDENDLENNNMKKKGILSGKGKDIIIDWLIKNINDQFVMNTLKEIKQNMYELSAHLNFNEQVPSNNSSLAMRTRQLALENKCKSNIDAMFNLIRERCRFLFKYLEILQNKKYDYLLIKPKFTPSLPQDDLMMAQILSQINGQNLVSKQTARAQFSFIDNVTFEEQQVKKEQEEELTIDLDKVDENG